MLPLLDGIREALAVNDSAPAITYATRLAAVLPRLENLLEIGEMAANELARTEEPLLRAGLGADGDTLLRQIANFDYEVALATLRATDLYSSNSRKK